MNIEQFMKTVYLGDRFLKEIVIDSYNKEIKLKINLISRIRNSDGIWNNYNVYYKTEIYLYVAI